MPSLNFETGLKTLDINGDPSRLIVFPPSDGYFVTLIYEGFEKIEEYYKGFSANVEAAQGTKDVLSLSAEADKYIREVFDDIFANFNEGAADIIFGKLNACGIAGGVPLWASIIVSIINECDDYLASQETAKNPQFKRLMAKYGKKK